MEKTEEQIARERAAVDAMKNAKASMTGALERIATLESALDDARRSISSLKGYIAPTVYQYSNGSSAPVLCTVAADNAIAAIAKVLS